MTSQRFYRASLSLPILVPALTVLLLATFGYTTFMPVNTAATALAFSGIIGGVPYAILAVWWCRWIPGRSDAEIRRMAMRAPWAMLAAFIPVPFILSAIDRDVVEGLLLLAAAIPMILFFGYAYVAVTFCLHDFSRRHGLVQG